MTVTHPEHSTAANALACEAVSLFSSSKQSWGGFLPPSEGPAGLFMSQMSVCVCVGVVSLGGLNIPEPTVPEPD